MVARAGLLILDTVKLSKGWFKSSDNLHSKAHLKYRDTMASETVANDREKCALKWLFVELVVEIDTVQNTGSVMKNDIGFKSRKSLHLNPLSNVRIKCSIFLNK